ncbi:MAG: hypothetical protein KC646_14610 [Candidatus Cloacimonetes bacterium]|nr:hypothetical protein [Candidatus Cloacimonadota bacterium]
MTLKIASKNYALTLEMQQSVYIDQKINHSIHFISSDTIKNLLLNEDFYTKLQSLSVLEVFSIFDSSDEDLKDFLVDSPFVPVLKSNFSTLFHTEQIQIICSLLKLAQFNNIHVKFPESFFNGCSLHALFIGLTQLNCTLIWEASHFPTHCDFDFYGDSTGIKQELSLPTSPSHVQNYFGEETYFLHGSFTSTDDNFLCKFGNLNIELSNDDKLLFLGLMNHNGLFSFIPSQFTFHAKEKKGLIKCEFIKQYKRATIHYAHISFKGIPLLVKSVKKFSTPFIFVNPNLAQCLIFHKEKSQLLFPIEEKKS